MLNNSYGLDKFSLLGDWTRLIMVAVQLPIKGYCSSSHHRLQKLVLRGTENFNGRDHCNIFLATVFWAQMKIQLFSCQVSKLRVEGIQTRVAEIHFDHDVPGSQCL